MGPVGWIMLKIVASLGMGSGSDWLRSLVESSIHVGSWLYLLVWWKWVEVVERVVRWTCPIRRIILILFFFFGYTYIHPLATVTYLIIDYISNNLPNPCQLYSPVLIIIVTRARRKRASLHPLEKKSKTEVMP